MAAIDEQHSAANKSGFFAEKETGDIGDVLTYYATYYTSPVKPMPPASERPAGMSDIEWQLRNWYNYTWLGGGGLVEQAVHSVDKIGWVMGDQSPLLCRATGGSSRVLVQPRPETQK